MNYVICSTGRARSSVLMTYMKQLGSGYPDEWTNSWFNKHRDHKDLNEVIKHIHKRKTDGHISLRITWSGLLKICRQHNIKSKEFFDKAVPDAKYILFTRDELSQSVESLYYKISQSFSDSLDIVPHVDIDKHMTDLAIDLTCWEIFFDTHNIKPHRVRCEDLLKDREGTCQKVLEFLGIPYTHNALEDRSKDMDLNHSDIQRWYNQSISRYLNVMKKKEGAGGKTNKNSTNNPKKGRRRNR